MATTQQPTRLRLVLPILRSKKNTTRIMVDRRTGSRWIGKDARVKQQEEAIRAAVRAANPGHALPLFGDDDVEVTVDWQWRKQRVVVVVRSLGPAPVVDGCTGRGRDMANMLDTLLDALQGVAYRNDSQVALLTAAKVAQ